MPRRLRSNRGISAQQAHQALSVLLHDGRVRASEVWKAVKRRERLVEELRGRLAALGGDMKGVVAKDGPFPMLAKMARTTKRRGRRKGRRTISQAQKSAWKAQGRYMAAVRRLPKAARAKVKAIREKSGVAAAIREARRLKPAR